MESDAYFSTSGFTYSQTTTRLGTSSDDDSTGNYHVTLTDYDSRGRLKRVQTPTGTITRSIYDVRGLLTSTWVGTDDTPTSGYWSPTNTGGTNLVEVSSNEYDNNAGGGDGNITSQTSYPGGSAAPRTTLNYFDWRNRVVATKSGYQATESTSDNSHPITYKQYDNLNEVTESQQYDGDTYIVTQTVPTAPSFSNAGFESGAAGAWTLTDASVVSSFGKTGYDGTYVASLDGEGASIGQSVTMSTGGLYTISFKVGGQGDSLPDTMQIALDGTVITVVPPPTFSDVEFENAVSLPFYVSAGTHTITIEDDDARLYSDGEGIDSVALNGVAPAGAVQVAAPSMPDPTLLRAETTYNFDNQGRLYSTHTFSVNPTNGDVSSDSIDTNSWYDVRGNVIKTQKTGQASTKTTYDGADRPAVVSTTDAGGDAAAGASGNWSDAGNVTGDTVLEQDETVYDAASNPIETIDRQRFHDDTGTGALGTPTSGNHARVYYTSSFYDGANRLMATANVGTNGGSAYTQPSSVPSRSDTTLITSYTYNPAGWVNEVTDPRGIITKTNYDALGRTTHTIADYTDGTPTDRTNQTTGYTYDGDDHVITQTAVLPDSDEQETKYIYGVTTAAGSNINSNDILAETDYPDLDTGEASSDEAETYTVNALGERTGMTDRNGNVHAYTYDVLGRQTFDAVTTLGDGVDGTIRAIGTAYNSAGQPYLHTSYSNAAGTTVANQVEDIFNGLGQMIGEYQSHSGAVSIGTTPEVQWGYSTIANGSRKSDLVYPNGRQVDYNYASGLDNSISRLTSESDDATSTVLESYKYLGAGTVVERDHPQDGVNLTYISATSTGDGGDQYVGLDRFGRVIDQNWTNGTSSVDDYQYGYDRDGNVLYKLNTVSTANSELYSYDNLNRLITFSRGTLNTGHTAVTGTPSETESWGLDALGNWLSNTVNGTETDRTYDHQNELITDGSETLTYDADGNMLTDEKGYVYGYDAWSRRLGSDGGAAAGGSPHVGRGPLIPLTRGESYTYDALGRRIQDGQVSYGMYYDGWQVIQEDYPSSSTTLKDQYVWSPVYVNAMVERDTSGTRLYVTQDANWNATAIFNTSGVAQERYLYDPYGSVTYMDGSFTVESAGNATLNWQFLFQGGKLDHDGMYWFEHRDEDATLGDWAEQDPKGYVDGSSMYQFVRNEPLTHRDAKGLATYGAIGGYGFVGVGGTSFEGGGGVSWTQFDGLEIGPEGYVSKGSRVSVGVGAWGWPVKGGYGYGPVFTLGPIELCKDQTSGYIYLGATFPIRRPFVGGGGIILAPLPPSPPPLVMPPTPPVGAYEFWTGLN